MPARLTCYSAVGFLMYIPSALSMLPCTERDFLAITLADVNLFASCFQTHDWSWKLAFQDCLVSQADVSAACAVALRKAAFPSFISPSTCEAGLCDVKYAIQRAVASLISDTELTSGECSSVDLSELAALEDSVTGALPSAAPGLSSGCTTCLSEETACPDASPGDVCHSDSSPARCFGCKQMNAAKQAVTCSIPENTNAHSYDCSAWDLEYLTNFELNGAVECFADAIGWQGAVSYCLYTRGVSLGCTAFMTSQVFSSQEDQTCVSGIGPTNEATTNGCLIPMWMRGTASVLFSSSAISTLTRVQTCTDSDLERLSTVADTAALTAIVSSLTSSCQSCVGADPLSEVESACSIYCDSANANYQDMTWACSACVQFQAVKTLTNCNIGATNSASSYSLTSMLAVIVGLISLLA